MYEGPRGRARQCSTSTQRSSTLLASTALQQQLWENAREKLRAELGPDAELQDVDLIVEMARLVPASDADGSVPGRRLVDGSIYKVVVRGRPEDAALSSTLRAKVLHRDRDRCCHCGCRRHLHVHHVTWRRHGGRKVMHNLVTLCAKCHRLVHLELLGVEVAHGATAEKIGFVFRDAHGYRVDRWPLPGPRIRPEPARGEAQGATPDEPPLALDGRWLRDHLHWFADSPRGPVVKPAYRDAFEQLAPRRA